ncbi:HU family DNA-binding protein [Streptomyces sp. NPDC052687]|uniref:HU family DNA-binding protein n=1 Tax=Streptomyces sp. NPDC052687 TaxID=3154759 RepID=UPI003435A1CE
MNKAQLVEAIADKMGGRQQAADAVDHVLDAIVRAVVAGERVSVTGFGSFEKVERPARYARNPQTGERVRVKKTSVPRFRAGQGFKDLVSGTKKLPKGDIAVKKAPKGSLSGPPPTIAKSTGKKAAAKKTAGAAKTTAAKKTTTATAKKTTATAKKTTATAAKKTTAKKAPAKKTTTTAKTTAAKTTTAKKATAKKAPAKKATAKKAPAKKSTARSTAKKTTARKK